jgi:large subunit ribosomal protein L37Ae
MAKTKGPAGRFGARAGVKIRRKINLIESKQKAKQKCPYCDAKAVKRVSLGIYACRKCKAKFTGGAYTI